MHYALCLPASNTKALVFCLASFTSVLLFLSHCLTKVTTQTPQNAKLNTATCEVVTV